MERMTGRPWRIVRQNVLDESTVCALCGHEGSDSVDHITPVALGGSSEYYNLQAAHFKPCPTCGIRCNLAKGSKVINTVHTHVPSRKWY